jgi:pyruvate dehydrogenase (quinone)
VAERLGAATAKALLGTAAVPDDLPFVTGSVGRLGTRAINEMMASGSGMLATTGSAVPDQMRAMQFYGQQVLPTF